MLRWVLLINCLLFLQMEILIKEYLDTEYQIFSTDEMDRMSESDASKNKAAKQWFGVAKQFGSIGKSVSKKIWSMTKRPKSPPSAIISGPAGEGILCVKIKIKRHEYVDLMLQNYLQCAHSR